MVQVNMETAFILNFDSSGLHSSAENNPSIFLQNTNPYHFELNAVAEM